MDSNTIDHQIYSDTPTEPLTASEEKKMVERYRKGDLYARQRLIETNLRFVIKVSLNYINQGLPLADIIQEGNLGLMEALEKFRPDKNCRLITYASWWIRLYIQRALEQKTRQVNLPINKSEILRKIRSFEKSYFSQHGYKPTVEVIANALGFEHTKIAEICDAAPTFLTLHASDEEHPGSEVVIIDENQEDPRDHLWMEEAVNRLDDAMKVLSSRERDVLTHRYNLGDCGKKLSLRKVGERLGLSAEGVRRIEEQAMNKLRRPVIKEKIEMLFAM